MDRGLTRDIRWKKLFQGADGQGDCDLRAGSQSGRYAGDSRVNGGRVERMRAKEKDWRIERGGDVKNTFSKGA